MKRIILFIAMVLLFLSIPGRTAEQDDFAKLEKEIIESSENDKEKNNRLLELYENEADKKMGLGFGSEALQLYTKANRCADAIGNNMAEKRLLEKTKDARSMKIVEARINAARKTLENDPGNQAALKKLILLHFVELDDINAAKELLPGCDDLLLKTCITMIGKNIEEVSAFDCLELCNWLEELSSGLSTSRNGKINVLLKAEKYYQYATGTKKLKSEEQARVEQGLERIKKKLKLLGYIPPGMVATGTWISLLESFDPDWDLTQGKTGLDGNILAMGEGEERRESFTVFPIAPDGSYNFRAQLASKEHSPYMECSFPVGTEHAVTFGINRYESGFGDIDGKRWDRSDNVTNRRFSDKLSSGKSYKLEMKIKHEDGNVQLAAAVNGHKVAQWKGTTKNLDRSPGIPVIVLRNRWGVGYFKQPELFIVSGKCIKRSLERDRKYAEKNIPVITRLSHFRVPGSIPWTLAGRVEKGGRYKIKHEGGKWYNEFDIGAECGPGGKDGKYCLQGRIGEGKSFNMEDDAVLEADRAGPLYVGMSTDKGDEFDNNFGSIRFSMVSVPEQDNEPWPIWHPRHVELPAKEKWVKVGEIQKGEYYKIELERPRGRRSWHYPGRSDDDDVNSVNIDSPKSEYYVEFRIAGGETFRINSGRSMLLAPADGLLEAGINKVSQKIIGECGFNIERFDLVKQSDNARKNIANHYYYELRRIINRLEREKEKAEKEKRPRKEKRKK